MIIPLLGSLEIAWGSIVPDSIVLWCSHGGTLSSVTLLLEPTIQHLQTYPKNTAKPLSIFASRLSSVFESPGSLNGAYSEASHTNLQVAANKENCLRVLICIEFYV